MKQHNVKKFQLEMLKIDFDRQFNTNSDVVSFEAVNSLHRLYTEIDAEEERRCSAEFRLVLVRAIYKLVACLGDTKTKVEGYSDESTRLVRKFVYYTWYTYRYNV